MATKVEAEVSNYEYIEDGDHNYTHLQGQPQANTDNNGHNERNTKPPRTESAVGTDNHARCKRPPWWVWLLVVLCVAIIAGLVAVLVFMLKSNPEQNVSESQNSGVLAGANCQALYNAGHVTSGVRMIKPDGTNKIKVYCEQELDGGGWTLFQRRINGEVDFNKKWSEYRDGFGDVAGEHWLGNNNIHGLTTAAGNQKLKIEMTHPNGLLTYADYTRFMIENEDNKFRLRVSGYRFRNPPGDSLIYHSGSAFTTLDRDNDAGELNCAYYHPGGWWFKDCLISQLNGVYNDVDWRGIVWGTWLLKNQSLVNVRMMIKTDLE